MDLSSLFFFFIEAMKRNLVLWLFTEVQIGATIYGNIPLWELAKRQNICRLIMTLFPDFLSINNK